MRITPLDIQQKQFPVKFRGFHAEEVSSFLELIREEIEDLLRENASLKGQLQLHDEEIRRFWEMEDLLGQVLQDAHRAADEYRIHARREADLLQEQAAERAEELVARAREKAMGINEEIVDLKMMRKRFHDDMQEVLGRFRDILNDEALGRKEAVHLHALSAEGEESVPAAPSAGEVVPAELFPEE